MYNVANILCSEGVSVDISTKQVSVFNIIERINVISLPVLLPNLCLLAIITRDKGETPTAKAEAYIKNNDQEIFKMPLEIDFKDTSVFRSVMKLQGIAILNAGYIEIGIRIEGSVLGSVKMEVAMASPDPEPFKKVDI